MVILSFIFVKQQLTAKDTESQERLARELDTASKTYEAKLASYKAGIERLEAQKRKNEDELSKARVSLRLRNGALRLKRNGIN